MPDRLSEESVQQVETTEDDEHVRSCWRAKYVPTPQEIEAACAEIRRGRRERRLRWEVPVLSELTLQ